MPMNHLLLSKPLEFDDDRRPLSRWSLRNGPIVAASSSRRSPPKTVPPQAARCAQAVHPQAVLPAPQAVLPAPQAVLPAPQAVLPAPQAVLPAPQAVLPAPQAVLPAPQAVLPAPLAVLPAPQAQAPPQPQNLPDAPPQRLRAVLRSFREELTNMDHICLIIPEIFMSYLQSDASATREYVFLLSKWGNVAVKEANWYRYGIHFLISAFVVGWVSVMGSSFSRSWNIGRFSRYYGLGMTVAGRVELGSLVANGLFTTALLLGGVCPGLLLLARGGFAYLVRAFKKTITRNWN